MRSHPRRTPLAATLAAFALVASSCSTWHSIGKDRPAEFIAREKPSAVRVSFADSMLVLIGPALQGDTLLGLAKGDPSRHVGIPLSEIRRLDVRTLRGSTAGKVIVGTFWATGLALAIYSLFHHDPPIP
ncbi:MAG: hypothetical protein E6K76_03325 [Candidatus Eisenbacteria bacterium]|uniref:Uncharacterized protein n=1 Tax=Eiseniibacteriota bacterium TaxID=2212470 RepID=A0A538T8J7_UNCEI|nr:MAG: hypothetical protein E6K76_03325 [Candidatus Eisenbacteria bacterium]